MQTAVPQCLLLTSTSQLFVRATSLPQAARELLSRNGILGWTAALTPVDAIERRLLIKIVVNVAAVVSGDKLPVVADALDALSSLSDADEGQPFGFAGRCIAYC